jgi:hypothetical protein
VSARLPVPGDLVGWRHIRELTLMVAVDSHAPADDNVGPSWILRDAITVKNDWMQRFTLHSDRHGIHCSMIREIARAK